MSLVGCPDPNTSEQAAPLLPSWGVRRIFHPSLSFGEDARCGHCCDSSSYFLGFVVEQCADVGPKLDPLECSRLSWGGRFAAPDPPLVKSLIYATERWYGQFGGSGFPAFVHLEVFLIFVHLLALLVIRGGFVGIPYGLQR